MPRGPTFLGWSDPRTLPGQRLFPKRFPEAVLADDRKRLGTAGYAGQHQQRPSAVGGNLFAREWWRFWSQLPDVKRRPQGCTELPPKVIALSGGRFHFDEVLISVDAAFKDLLTSDFVVSAVIARKGAERFVLACARGHWGFKATCDVIRQQRKEWPMARTILIEDKANGSAIVETLKQEITGVLEVNPEGGKEARAEAVRPEVEAGQVYLPEGAEWIEAWVTEFADFPLGRNDDQVDSLSQALIRMGNSDAARARALLSR